MKGKEIWTPALDQRLKDLYRKQRETMWLPIAAELGVDWYETACFIDHVLTIAGMMSKLEQRLWV